MPFKLILLAIFPAFALANRLITVINSCSETINPMVFQSSATVPSSLGTFSPGTTVTTAVGNNVSAIIYANSGGGNQGRNGALKASLELSSNFYYILKDSGFDHGISISADSPQEQGFCTTATCATANCTDTFQSPPSLPNIGGAPLSPLHQCSKVDVAFTVTFCPRENLPNSVQLHPNGNTAKCLDVRAAELANGTAVQIFDCNQTGAQNWLINLGNTKVQLAGTNFCLDAGTTPANNVGMKIWTCFENLPAQAWFYTGDNRIAVTGKGQCLDLTNGDLTNGNRVQTFHCTAGNTNQIWTT